MPRVLQCVVHLPCHPSLGCLRRMKVYVNCSQAKANNQAQGICSHDFCSDANTASLQ